MAARIEARWFARSRSGDRPSLHAPVLVLRITGGEICLNAFFDSIVGDLHLASVSRFIVYDLFGGVSVCRLAYAREAPP